MSNKPVQIRQPQQVVLSLAAAQKVWCLMQEEDNLALKLRAFVTGGGCSGLQYGFSFEETVNEDDTVISVDLSGQKSSESEDDEDDGGSDGGQTVRLLIDPISLPYLLGAEIDYKEDVEGAQFIIRNPNAKTTCGCGSSFSV